MTALTASLRQRPLAVDQLAILVRRNLRTSARVPQLLMFSLTMPMAMLVLFSQVFRSVADSPGFPAGVSYIDFLTPAMLAVATVMAGTNAGRRRGDRPHQRPPRPLRHPADVQPSPQRRTHHQRDRCSRWPAAPSSSPPPSLLGFRFHGTAIDAVVSVVVLMALAAAMSALFGRIGDRVRRPDVVQFAGMMIMMPFMFISGAFAPLATMPGWMRTMAAFNPVAHATEALRGNVLGTSTAAGTATALASAAASVGPRHAGAERAALRRCSTSSGTANSIRNASSYAAMGRCGRLSRRCSTCWFC